ncbi:MAG: restriction endonuclease subunit S [Candidatus Endonucleobacter bathymodioli]|uniref:Restriction endonuclease subunit S n=1 Tax=Candidatus Endonucleibacter bathymodioli TaxID=539814 RepID=A0AA90SU46_9GAMM|nr:restriction endonuclease subunit S [Candidatus Endonucleobacter bathymodioli]
MRYKQYESYKESGVEWLSEVPTEWNILRNKQAFSFVKHLVGKNSNDYILLSLTLQGIKVRDIESGKGKFPAEFDTYQAVKKKDIIFCLFDIDETPRTIGMSHNKGMITGAYNVARCNSKSIPEFIYYYYLSIDEYKGLKPFYTGLRKVVRTETFMNIQLPLPPLQEQKAIATYLDRATQKIDTLIEKQSCLIALLKEKRQALISHAVTKGLDPHAKMIDSGVEWLGEIPEGWEVKKLKYALSLQTEKVSIQKQKVIALENIESWSGKLVDTESNYQGEDVAFQKGDILFGKLRPYLAKVYQCQDDGVAFGDILVYRPNKNTVPQFAFYSMLSESFIDIVDGSTFGSKMPRASVEFVSNMPISIPVKEEQKAIATYLDDKTQKIDTLIAKATKSIELLKEKRTALISAVVTGKVDVRETSQ